MIRPITDTLRFIEGGTFIDEASDKLAEIVRKVEETGKAGELTMKITVRQASAGALALTGIVSAKVPKDKPIEVLLFSTPEGNLLTSDPRQKDLDLKPIAVEPTRELKTINA